jgi:hypothetical protein
MKWCFASDTRVLEEKDRDIFRLATFPSKTESSFPESARTAVVARIVSQNDESFCCAYLEREYLGTFIISRSHAAALSSQQRAKLEERHNTNY